MSLEVQGPPAMELGGVELEDLVLGGDDNAWAMDDWAWDGKTFTATPLAAAARAGKRHCSGLHLEGLAANGFNQSAAAKGLCCGGSFSNCEAKEERSNSADSGNFRDQDGTSLEPVESGKSPACQVEDCGKDLAGLSTYYQRCRICEVHIKEPQFFRNGKLQRFCQQCGRCHELTAFQGSKRSCREQLAKHNARRRRRTKGSSATADELLSTRPSSSPCQARLTDTFASLGAFFPSQQGSHVEGASQQASIGLPTSAADFAAISFPAASLGTGGLAPGSEAGSLLLPQPPLQMSANRAELATVVGIPVLTEDSSLALQKTSFETAMAMLGPPAAPTREYRSENLVVRLSVKLFNCTPAELPSDLQQQLTGWLKSTPAGAEGYLRPGCVHLILQAHLAAQSADQISKEGLSELAAHLINQQSPVWKERAVLLDLNGSLALLKDGQLISTWGASCEAAPKPSSEELGLSALPARNVVPQLHLADPAAVCLDNFVGGSARLHIEGRGIACGDCKIVCRSQGIYHEVRHAHFGACCEPGQEHMLDAKQSIVIELPRSLQPGLAWLEVHKGCLLSRPLPILICTTPALAAELAAPPGMSRSSHEALLADVGLLMACRGESSMQLSATADRVAELACRTDLPALLQFLAGDFEAQCIRPRGGELSLLHLAVQHKSRNAILMLLSMRTALVGHPGPQGITPLHLAAIAEDDSASARLLMAHCCPTAWMQLVTTDGLSPSDFARQAGHCALDSEMTALRHLPESNPAPFFAGGQQGPFSSPEASSASQDYVLEVRQVEEMTDTDSSESGALLGAPEMVPVGTCMAWPGPLSAVAPTNLIGKWSNVALLGVVACVCTCVVLLRDWA